tara:strand:- start:83 stop:1072 length:990 start_codon:yes stop_codon:yes gene_type:complete
MNLIKNMALPNTMGLASFAEFGCLLKRRDDVLAAQELARSRDLPFYVIGAGSNIVPMPTVRGVVGVMAIEGLRVVNEQGADLQLEVGAGQNWHELVLYCAEHNWYGIENLALIPGSVGAAPVQNIGAYGVEFADVVDAVQVIDGDGNVFWLGRDECAFAYRRSRFQGSREETIIAVRLNLSKAAHIKIDYPDLANHFQGHLNLTTKQIVTAVIAIRSAKLPDPAVFPNVGSFFKNPIIDRSRIAHFEELGLSVFHTQTGAKLSAAQLIDKCGWKEEQTGHVRCWPKQPLVLVNHGATEATHIFEFASDVRASVAKDFAIQLEIEPSVLS